MSISDIFIIVAVVVVIVLFILYRVSSKNYKRAIEADDFIKANKQVASIYIIDKKYAKPTEKDLNKQIYDQLTPSAKRHKLCMVKAKVGPQIFTLITDKNVYDVLTPKKTVKVELSGLYIVSVVGVNLQDKKKKTWREKLSLFTKADPKKEAEKIVNK
ncbi:MAG: hypothetical protein PUD43_10065 [Clostridia bacterium]|nr:hypothetical protein [Clostridia bacterium]